MVLNLVLEGMIGPVADLAKPLFFSSTFSLPFGFVVASFSLYKESVQRESVDIFSSAANRLSVLTDGVWDLVDTLLFSFLLSAVVVESLLTIESLCCLFAFPFNFLLGDVELAAAARLIAGEQFLEESDDDNGRMFLRRFVTGAGFSVTVFCGLFGSRYLDFT